MARHEQRAAGRRPHGARDDAFAGARGCVRLLCLTTAALLLLAATTAQAQAGSTLTPDRLTYVVNKDLAGERWTITLNLASLEPERFISVTGNVFRPGGAPPSFVWCQLRADSTGTLADPASVFRLRCGGSDSCDETAIGCARSSWRPLADLVAIPVAFFLPPGGAGAGTASGPHEVALREIADGAARIAGAASSRGTTLSPDAANFLVNKDVGADRWSISLNLVPAQTVEESLAALQGIGRTASGRLEGRRLSVTGSVFPPDGGEPSFVFCQELQSSTGRLTELSSEFRLSCQGTGRCLGSALDCARNDWRPIPDGTDVRIGASFFLPQGGLPATSSDPEIIVIGRTSDPPSIGVNSHGSSSESRIAGTACDDQACTIAIGSCARVAGVLKPSSAETCTCFVENVPADCVTCGDGASGSCGGACEYQVSRGGPITVRGQCLPVSDDSTECACYAGDEDGVPVGQCGGALGVLCPQEKCCADDVRDGCDPRRGDTDCPGICVRSEGCDPTQEQCGICLDQRGTEGSSCGSGDILPGEDCCVEDGSCRSGSSFCFCKAGAVCVTDGEKDLCCTATKPNLCPGGGCAPDGADCCGGRKYCAAGSLCTTNPTKCCPADMPQICDDEICVDEGSDCCGNGTACAPGRVCTSIAGKCCPANLPQICPDLSGCVREGAVCCGNGRACPPGTTCELLPDGGVNCIPASASAGGGARAAIAAVATTITPAEYVAPTTSNE